jgi:hypothetical protein
MPPHLNIHFFRFVYSLQIRYLFLRIIPSPGTYGEHPANKLNSLGIYFESRDPDKGLAYPLKILFGKYPNLALSLWLLIQDTLISIVGRLPDPETFAQLPDRDETLLIVLVNVMRLFGGTMLPNEPRDTYPVVSAMNWDYAATTALAGMFALIFQEPLVDKRRFTTEDPERDGEPYRWFIPAGSPFC